MKKRGKSLIPFEEMFGKQSLKHFSWLKYHVDYNLQVSLSTGNNMVTLHLLLSFNHVGLVTVGINSSLSFEMCNVI